MHRARSIFQAPATSLRPGPGEPRYFLLKPRQYGVSDVLSPATIVTGRGPPDFQRLKLEFGEYVQVFEENRPTNTPKARTLGAIVLHPTGNAQGDYYFLSLATGARISRHTWISVPTTEMAIARVEALASQENQPLVQQDGLLVEWEHDGDAYDPDFDPLPQDEEDDLPDDFEPLDPNELLDLNNEAPFQQIAPPVFMEEHAEPGADINDYNNFYEPEEEPGANQGAQPEEEPLIDPPPEEEPMAAPEEELPMIHIGEQNEEADEANEVEMNDNDVIQPTYNLRPRAERVTFAAKMDNPHSSQSYTVPYQLLQHTSDSLENDGQKEMKAYVFGFIMNQMTANAAIKKYGKVAERALMEEFAQLDDLSVFEPIHSRQLTRQQKKETLRAINLIKEKKDGRIKGRTVADGRPQRARYEKSETTSPTISTDALMVSIVIDAHEHRDVATADVAGAFLKADMDHFTVIKFDGKSVDLMCETNKKYIPFVVSENGK